MKKYIKKILSLMLAAVMSFSVAAGLNITARASAVFGEDIVEFARQYLGCKYEYAHSGPDTFDCSGYVSFVYRNFGITLPTSSGEYWRNPAAYGTVIGENSIDDAQPGDIISWNGHVAIYTEDGYVIEAANSRLGVVERKYDLKKWNGNYHVIRVYGVESKGNIILGVAENLAASKITGISANVKWTPVEFADGYLVYILKSADGNWQRAGTTITNEYNFRNLTFNHAYSVKVMPYRLVGSETVYGDYWSHSCGFKTLTADEALKILPTVDYVRFSNATENSVNVTYNSVWGANMYQIQYSADKENWTTAADTSAAAATLTGFETDSLYYVRVKAYAKSGSEFAVPDKYSDVYRFYTQPKAADPSLILFEDLNGYQSYSGFVAYTSVYNSYIAGTNPPEFTQFSPVTSITRAMFVTILYRMAGNPYDDVNPYEENPFTDVSEDSYYFNASCWALDNEITNQTTFKPDDSVTREQTAKFLYYYAKMNGSLGESDYRNVDLSDYPDYDEVHGWAEEPLQWANYNGMITGTVQGYINPRGATQRIHAAKILYRFGKTCNIGNFS